jgi:tryptophan synthase alpha chain
MTQIQPLPIMAHLVLGYPTLAESIETAEMYVAAGVGILELQIPFSHPTADGPVITAACREAIDGQHTTVDDCLGAIRTIRQKYPDQEIVVMSYLNRVFTYSPDRFTAAMAQLGIRHLIIPDLPVDSPLAGRFTGLQLIPVLAANVTDGRLDQLAQHGFDFYYLMSDFKITGSTFGLHPRLKHVIARLKAGGNGKPPRIGIGFGIATPDQVRVVLEEADVAIIGSALIQAKEQGTLEALLASLQMVFVPG